MPQNTGFLLFLNGKGSKDVEDNTYLGFHLPSTSSILVLFFNVLNVRYITNPTIKNIIQSKSNSHFPSANMSPIISRKVKDAIITKKPVYSLLRTVLNENGSSGLCQFFNRGRNNGVFQPIPDISLQIVLVKILLLQTLSFHNITRS